MHEFLSSPLRVALGAILGMAVPWLVTAPIWWWSSHNDQRQWDRREAERQRQ